MRSAGIQPTAKGTASSRSSYPASLSSKAFQQPSSRSKMQKKITPNTVERKVYAFVHLAMGFFYFCVFFFEDQIHSSSSSSSSSSTPQQQLQQLQTSTSLASTFSNFAQTNRFLSLTNLPSQMLTGRNQKQTQMNQWYQLNPWLRGFTNGILWLETMGKVDWSSNNQLPLGKVLQWFALETTHQQHQQVIQQILMSLSKCFVQSSIGFFLLFQRAIPNGQRLLWLLAWICLGFAMQLVSCVCMEQFFRHVPSLVQASKQKQLQQDDNGIDQTKADEKDMVNLMALVMSVSFFIKLVALGLVNVLLARAYQRLLAPKLPTKWVQIPGFVGSKRLILSSCYGCMALMTLMAITSGSLRCLVEGIAQIEKLAFVVSHLHATYCQLRGFPPHVDQEKNDAAIKGKVKTV